MKVGIYVHIPFCQSRCIYCGFYSTTTKNLQNRYINAVIREMQIRNQNSQSPKSPLYGCNLETIYLGGGTPSTLHTNDIGRIISAIRANYNGAPNEITIEVNPDDVNENFIKEIKTFGINRISIGIQTFNNAQLRFANRRHTADEAINAVHVIRQSGIDNISIDLMFGFPEETLDDWRKDLQTALNLNVEHISAYSLMYEEGTPLYNMLQLGKVNQIDDEKSRQMYLLLIDTLVSHGYEHYEISNFCKPGRRATHNSNYWNGTPYIGLGAAAHSYDLETRSWNIANINKYMHDVEHGILPSESELIDNVTHYNDLITTSLRTKEGLNLKTLPIDFRQYAITSVQNDIKAGLAEISNDHIRLTRNGLFVSDMVMSNLIKLK